MRVQVNDAVAVGPTNGFGEIPVVGDGGANAGDSDEPRRRRDQPRRTSTPSASISTTRCACPVPIVNVGDGFTTPAVGVLDYSFGNFKLNVTTALTRVDRGRWRRR